MSRVRYAWIFSLLAAILATMPLRAADDSKGATDEPRPVASEKVDVEKAEPKSTKSDAADDEDSTVPAKAHSRLSTKPTAADRKAEAEYFELYKSLADTVDQVERNYVKPVDRRELMEAAIKGIITKLDPYSNYISPDEITSFRTSVEAQFGGIGIHVMADDGQIVVSSPLVGTPAYRAGVQAGDRIIKIEGEPTRGLPLDEVVRKLKGEIGTSVTFTVAHGLGGKSETFTIKREVIHVDTVTGYDRKADDSWNFMLDSEHRIGYIRLTAFSRETAADLKRALEELKRQKMRALILDLRFNPGGLLTSAIEISDMFVSEGRIVSTKGRNTPERVWDAVKPGTFEGFPMVVLVNHFSASASEIVSACLQDHNRAVVVGDRTWGKGSVQNVIELEDGKSALKLTTATYTRPNGHNIHRFPDAKESDEWGVKPNDGLEVKLSEREISMLLADWRQRDIVHSHQHEESLAAKPGESSSDQKSDSAPAKRLPSVDSAHDAANQWLTDPSHSTADDDATVKPSGSSTKSDPSASKQPPAGSTPQIRTGSSTKPGAPTSKNSSREPNSKFSDPQLQKGIDYLTTELARAQ